MPTRRIFPVSVAGRGVKVGDGAGVSVEVGMAVGEGIVVTWPLQAVSNTIEVKTIEMIVAIFLSNLFPISLNTIYLPDRNEWQTGDEFALRKCLDSRLRPAKDQGVDIVCPFVGVDRLQVHHVANDMIFI